MGDSSAFGFGKFIPGFDFLQNLGKPSSPASGLPPFAHWVAPTVSVEEIEKRIEELKAVQFWLEQNSKALTATVQALEVQKMTLSTLKGMNVNLAEMAKAFPFAAAAGAAPDNTPNDLSGWPMSGAQPPHPQAAAQADEAPTVSEAAPATEEAKPDAAQAASMATAMQWWGALTQQFQQIAQQAMQDPAQQQAMLQATQMSTEFAKTAVKTASDMVRQAVVKTTRPTSGVKAASPKAAKTASQPAAKRAAPAKKAASADKKAPSAVAKSKGVAAKKPAATKTRIR